MSQPRFCQHCGHRNTLADTFCSQCGTQLTPNAESRFSEAPTADLTTIGTALLPEEPPSPHQWMMGTEPPREVVPRPPARSSTNLTPCPDCGRQCSRQAAACPGCGRQFRADTSLAPSPLPPPPPTSYLPVAAPSPPPSLQPQQVHYYYPQAYMPPPPQQVWNPGVAGALSFIVPGAGQMYKGHIGAGFLWFIAVFIGYILFILPGFMLHICCVVSAASGDTTKRS